MKIPSSRLSSLFPLLALSLLFLFHSSLQAQAPAKDPIWFTVDQTVWSPEGSLVIGIFLHSPNKQSLKLYEGKDVKYDPNNPAASNIKPFSLGDSYLVDGYTGNKIPPLDEVPRKPFLGPMVVSMTLNAGAATRLGVAFNPPSPPLGKDGKPLPYKLTLYIPLDATPIVVTPPPKP